MSLFSKYPYVAVLVFILCSKLKQLLVFKFCIDPVTTVESFRVYYETYNNKMISIYVYLYLFIYKHNIHNL
jgi:hypothetical protein